MMLKKLAAAIAALFATPDRRPRTPLGRRRFCDVADPSVFLGRMPAGIAGDVSRYHPVSTEPCLIDAAKPPLSYGIPVLNGAANIGVRPYGVADQSDATDSDPWGFTVRPFPAQQQSGGMTTTFGSGTPPTTGVIDVVRAGYIMGVLPAGQTPAKGDRVYVWCTASAAGHTQGGIENVFSAGNTTRLAARYTFNGPPDASGNVEVSCNV